MRARAAIALLAVAAALVGGAGEASAHPLGNFSINHLTEVRVSSDRVQLLYVLDQAEIPTFQERALSSSEVLERKRAEVLRGLELELDGRDVPLRPAGAPRLTFPAGAGGLDTTRLELPLAAGAERPRRVELRDRTFAGRAGWKAIVAVPGEGTAVRSSVPARDPTDRLRDYPAAGLESPLEQRSARLVAEPGAGTLSAPAGGRERGGERGAEAGFAAAFTDAASGDGVLAVLVLAALGWGALHALSPGHGKAMVAAYLIGTRGSARHALALGAVVTFTHTIGVFALGVVTLTLSQFIVPEDLYPWLNLVAGLMVVIVGAAVLRARWRRARRHARGHAHTHDHAHGHAHHHHAMPDEVTPKGVLAMGAAAGLIPCPSALVVLLGAISQHEIALGLLLIAAFSAGLAATLTALGLAVVYGRRLLAMARLPDRLARGSRSSALARLATALPAGSALLIVGVGFVLTAQALPEVA